MAFVIGLARTMSKHLLRYGTKRAVPYIRNSELYKRYSSLPAPIRTVIGFATGFAVDTKVQNAVVDTFLAEPISTRSYETSKTLNRTDYNRTGVTRGVRIW